MELSKQEMELFFLIPGLWWKLFYYGSILDFQLNFLGLEGLDLKVTLFPAIFVNFL